MKGFVRVVLFATGLMCVSAPITLHAITNTESSGIILFEAEDFDSQILHGSDHQWDLSNSVTGFGGTGYMEATPNTGLNNGGSTWLTTQPELQYSVDFLVNATHYVWIRAFATNGNDDSVHTGIDGTTNTASAITLVTSQYNAWNWTTNRTGGAAIPTVTPGSSGTHTFSLWMREDGMRVDRVLLTTNVNFHGTVGNAFHIPNDTEADLGVTMRNPFLAIVSNTTVQIFSANQFRGSGNPGDQLQTGSTLFFKRSTDSTWNSLPMTFYKTGASNTNNNYYSNSIPANVFSAGDTVQYYFKSPYSDHLPTFIYGTDSNRFDTEIESVAQANPFSYTVLAPAAPGTPSPADWRDQNIYQVITDRYKDGDPSNNTANPDGNYDPTSNGTIHGGDFEGLQQKLDYIKSLGATAIWISPVVRNAFGEYHGYGGWDFYTIDPHWGTFTDMTNMIAAAHARGLYVILDIVCNHGDDIIHSTDPNFTTVFKNPPNGYNLQFRHSNKQYPAPFNTNSLNPTISSLFHTNGLIQDFNNTTQVELGELRNLDDLRTETTYVRTNMANIYEYWVGQADFDGFRIDTVKHVDQGFWQYWCPQLHQFGATIGKSNFFMFGETEDGSEAKVGSYTGTKGGGSYELDSMVDYPLYFKVNSVFANATGNTKQIEDHYNGIAANYDSNAWYRLVTFLDNHDHPRFLSTSNANNNTNRLAVALAFLYTSRGIPCLYYGTEQAFNNGTPPDNREDMFAGQFESGPSVGDNFSETHPLFRLVAKLNNFRRLYPSLRSGVHNNLWNNPNGPGLFAYSRVLSTEEVFVVFNTAGSSQTLPNRSTSYPAGTVLVNLLNTNETIVVNSTPNIPSVTVPGTSAKIFIAKSLLKPLDPVVVSQSPAHAKTNVSTSAQIVLQFSKPMETNPVQAAFSLTPAVGGSFTWSALHDTMTFTAGGIGLPGLTTNVLRIGTNAMDAVSSNTFYAPFETYFVTAASSFSDTQSPTIFISMPVNGSTVSGALSVSGLASDNIGVQKVEISLDSGDWILASGTNSWSYSLNTANLPNGLHSLSARATDTSDNVSSIDSVTARFFNIPGDYLQRLSAGNSVDVTNCDSTVWIKDQAYSLGSFGYDGGSAEFVGNTISGICASAQSLYQHDRVSSPADGFRYLFDCPAGIYETTLLEVEKVASSPDQRVFNVFIEGQQVLTNFDIFSATGGTNIPTTLIFTNAAADAQMEIQFVPVTGGPLVSGVQVRKISDADSDSDGIPDWWTLAYFNHPTGQDADNSMASDDADGDGMSNLQEFQAGTDPTDPNSIFRITAVNVVGHDIAVTWTTQPNKTNQLENSGALGTNATWLSVGPLTIGTGSPATQIDPGAATNPPTYYRIRLLP